MANIDSVSGLVNGLLILSSVSLATAQFFYGHVRSRYDEVKGIVERIQDCIETLLKSDKVEKGDAESIKTENDNYQDEKVPNIGPQMIVLFIGLCCSAFSMITELAALIFPDYVKIAAVVWIAFIIAILLTGVIVWTGSCLEREFRRIRNYSRNVRAFKKNILTIARIVGVL